MTLGIFCVVLLMMAIVDVDQLFYSEEKRIAQEKRRREQILQSLKEQEVSIRLLHLRVKKEIADLEAKQEALIIPALPLDKKTQQFLCKVLCLVVMMLYKLWR